MSQSADILEAAKALMDLSACPTCGERDTLISHTSKGMKTCNGCDDVVCTKCSYGARYWCLCLHPLKRQIAIGVQSPKAEEKRENK